ncbi:MULTISPECIES: hypothetical protein [Methylomicrobium]|uniref:Uncharacterized protein n=1 Tax=Methylomicrobium album BG8 TaxID=686340 RepID=H8GLK3_METAL|nr:MULTISPECIES: hypothetical protein [Methylomicrobium]EIC29368.1 hypothetical protein Metal_1588 [Methylomicrobium album BG8]
MRINAKLDEQSEKNLQFIKEQTGETVTQIIKELLADKAGELRQKQQPGSKMKALLQSKFVGCGEGPEDGSVNYKKYIRDYIDEKFSHR